MIYEMLKYDTGEEKDKSFLISVPICGVWPNKHFMFNINVYQKELTCVPRSENNPFCKPSA